MQKKPSEAFKQPLSAQRPSEPAKPKDLGRDSKQFKPNSGKEPDVANDDSHSASSDKSHIHAGDRSRFPARPPVTGEIVEPVPSKTKPEATNVGGMLGLKKPTPSQNPDKEKEAPLTGNIFMQGAKASAPSPFAGGAAALAPINKLGNDSSKPPVEAVKPGGLFGEAKNENA